MSMSMLLCVLSFVRVVCAHAVDTLYNPSPTRGNDGYVRFASRKWRLVRGLTVSNVTISSVTISN
jgi:hypothetical protein